VCSSDAENKGVLYSQSGASAIKIMAVLQKDRRWVSDRYLIISPRLLTEVSTLNTKPFTASLQAGHKQSEHAFAFIQSLLVQSLCLELKKQKA